MKLFVSKYLYGMMHYVLLFNLSTAFALILGSCNSGSESDKFTGAWASENEGGLARPNSIFIKKNGEVYNCYFLSSKGEYELFKGIIDDDNLKIGSDYTIKYLPENSVLYLVENSMTYVKMKSIESTIEEMKSDIKSVDGANLSRYFYFPFSDDMANAYDDNPNFSMSRTDNISAVMKKLFDTKVKECFNDAKIVSYDHLDKDEVLKETMGVYIEPWEYTVSCENLEGRNLTFVFSIRNNEYNAIRLQYFP